MNDNDFMEMEIEVQRTLENFKNACDAQDMDFKDRLEDIIYNVENDT